MRVAIVALFFGIACLAGLLTSEVLWRAPAVRDPLTDLDARFSTDNLRRLVRAEAIEEDMIEREMNLLRYQFSDEQSFATALEAEGASVAAMRHHVTEHLRTRQWIEKQIANSLTVTEEECRQQYERSRADFMQPQRFRASHLFFAAPEGKPPEIVEGKRRAIQTFASRLAKQEPLAALVAEASEDEATKANGGDLGFFSAARMPPEFIAEVEKLRVGQVSAPFPTHLGFHIVELAEAKPPRQLSFDEARPEIERRLRNDRRTAAMGELAQRIALSDKSH